MRCGGFAGPLLGEGEFELAAIARIGLQADGFAEAGDGFIDVAVLGQGAAEVVEDACRVRLTGVSLAEASDRFGQSALPDLDKAEATVRLGIIRLETERVFVMNAGFVEAAGLPESIREVEVGRGAIGIEIDGSSILVDCGVQVSTATKLNTTMIVPQWRIG